MKGRHGRTEPGERNSKQSDTTVAAACGHRVSASKMTRPAGIFGHRLPSEPLPTLLPTGRRCCTCNSVKRQILTNPAQAHPEKVRALQVDSTEENRHLGILDSHSQ